MNDVYQYSTTEIIRILGQRARAYRIRLGLTQKELAERAGVSVPTSSRSVFSYHLSKKAILRGGFFYMVMR